MTDNQSSRSMFKRILFCTDFSETADFAFDFAIQLVGHNPQTELVLLHIVPECEAQFWKTYIYEVDNIDQKAKEDIDAVIDKRYKPRIPKGLNFNVQHRVGNKAKEIINFASENSIDLIIIGRAVKGTISKTFLGNITEKVARNAHCPVLIIPYSYHQKTAASAPNE